MGRTFIKGDTHGTYDLNDVKRFKVLYGDELTREDVFIVAGDFGALWSSYQNSDSETSSEEAVLNWWNDCPWTTLAILGNHENYHAYENYPVVKWNGGVCWQLRPNVYVACFGQYFTINGATYFTLNGARSHDIQDGILERGKDDEQIKLWWRDPYKMFRVLNESWWAEEVPNVDMRHDAEDVIAAHEWNVDYVITHEAPASDKALMGLDCEEYSEWLEYMRAKINYKHWYFGHLHQDWDINDKETALYHSVVEVGV